jgi:hypothetical protein
MSTFQRYFAFPVGAATAFTILFALIVSGTGLPDVVCYPKRRNHILRAPRGVREALE